MIVGHLLSFAVIGCCWLLLVVGCCWLLLVVFGCCWLLLVVVGCCWLLLVVIGCCWLLLVVVGCYWLLFVWLLGLFAWLLPSLQLKFRVCCPFLLECAELSTFRQNLCTNVKQTRNCQPDFSELKSIAQKLFVFYHNGRFIPVANKLIYP